MSDTNVVNVYSYRELPNMKIQYCFHSYYILFSYLAYTYR